MSSGSLPPQLKALIAMLFCFQIKILRDELRAWQGLQPPGLMVEFSWSMTSNIYTLTKAVLGTIQSHRHTGPMGLLEQFSRVSTLVVGLCKLSPPESRIS